MGKAGNRMLTAACVAIAVLLALNLAWKVADACLGLKDMMWRWRQNAWWADEEARGRLMGELYKDVLANREGLPDPFAVANDIEQVLEGKGVSATVRYAVAVIDGRICVAEMPPLALAHHCVMYDDGAVMFNADENLVAAIWVKALRDRTIVQVPW